jgi:hypothetical protein
MRSAAICVLSAAVFGAGCTSEPEGPPPALHGIVMRHAVTSDDSARLAGYGQVIAVVRADSAILLLTSVSEFQLEQVLGVWGVGPSLGADVTTGIEIRLGVTPVSLAVADSIASAVGRVESPQVLSTEVYASVPANRLGELNQFHQISDLWLGFDPERVQQ